MKRIIVGVVSIVAAAGFYAQAQEGDGMRHQPSPEIQAFCANHAEQCAQLKAAHEVARQTCTNPQATVGECQQAREQVKGELSSLEQMGMPAPQHGRGMWRRPGGGGQVPQ